MDKRVENFLNYSVKEMTGSEIISDIFITALFIWFATITVSKRLTFSVWGVLYLLALLGVGYYAKSKKSRKETFLYRGAVAAGYSALCFAISYGGLTWGRNGSFAIAAAYIVIYVLCCVSLVYLIHRLIEKDAYSTKEKPVSTGSIFISSSLTILLCPIIFAGFNENQAGAMIALIFLFVGACFIFGIANFYKAYLQNKLEKEKAINK